MNESIKQEIDNILTKSKVVVFMKGNANFPQCGFSGRAIALLKSSGINKEDIYTVNVLENENLRQAIKEYSNWPTIPQIYINKEFIGGSDILYEMYESGELKKLLDN